MPPKLNHTIVASHDKKASAVFLSEVLGLDPPLSFGHFVLVTVGHELTLDFVDTDIEVVPQHYTFLVSKGEFDEIFARIAARGLTYWADPMQKKPDEVNHWDDGRGVYFEDPDGHLLEILTRSYGSAGTSATNIHPLVANTITPKQQRQHRNGQRSGGGNLARREGSGS